MKRNLLLTLSFCITALFSFAQLAPGSDFSGNITGLDVNSDEAVDVQAWLDEGKVVVVDLFATWCPPCWSFHTSGYLEDMNERYGPNGTDQIRILGIEADASTAESLLFMEVAGGSAATTSLGNWTTNAATGEALNYSLIQSPEALNALPISYWPSLYMIQPSGKLVELGTLSPNPRTDEEFWLNAFGVTSDPALNLTGELGLSDFCFDLTTDDAEIEIFNPTQLDITTMSLDVIVNGDVVNTIEYDGMPLGSFETTTITVPGFVLTEGAQVEVVGSSINGTSGSFGLVSGNAGKFQVATETMTIVFTTDQYAAETSWSVSDDMGNELLAVGPYAAGPDAFGGGGADANTSHEYELSISSDVSCLTFTINDSYGDGLGTLTNALVANVNNPPGIEVFDQWGNVVKDNEFILNAAGQITGWTGEGVNFGGSTDVLVNAEMTTGVEAITELEGSKVYPNPVAETLNVELNFSEVTDYNIAIVDIYGKVVRSLGSYSNTQLSTNYNVEDLASGMYMITIQSDKGQNVMKFTKR